MTEKLRSMRQRKKKRYSLTLDPKIVDELQVKLKANHISLSGYVNGLIADSVAAMRGLPDDLGEMTIQQLSEFMNNFLKRAKE